MHVLDAEADFYFVQNQKLLFLFISPRYLYPVYFCSVVHFSDLPYTRNLCFGLFQSHGLFFGFQLHLNILTKRQLVAEQAWSLTRPQSSLLRKERSARGDGKEERGETTGRSLPLSSFPSPLALLSFLNRDDWGQVRHEIAWDHASVLRLMILRVSNFTCLSG